jgi:class 3 adenylate cyclase
VTLRERLSAIAAAQASFGVLPSDRLVTLLNDVFSELDELDERYGLEKIKTIGDARMAVAGLPEPRADHAQVKGRGEMQTYLLTGRLPSAAPRASAKAPAAVN